MCNQPGPRSFDLQMQRLLNMIIELQEIPCLTELKKMLDQGVDPKELQSCFMEGMRRVGIYFETGTYFISALIMAGEIMQSAMEMLSPYLTVRRKKHPGGSILLGTIKGDIHDLGKNLFSILLKCQGFDVIDLGVDVPARMFREKAQEVKPDIIGISCVLTSSLPNLKEAVRDLRETLHEPKPPIIIGGTCLDGRLARHVGSSLWAKDAAVGLEICQRLLIENKQAP